jgi:hypothetical protein
MIKGILVINNHGKPRLTKFYEHLVAPPGRRTAHLRRLRLPRLAAGLPCVRSRIGLPVHSPAVEACGAPGSPVDHAARKQHCAAFFRMAATCVCMPCRVASCLPCVHLGLTPVPRRLLPGLPRGACAARGAAAADDSRVFHADIEAL